jgi:hypothetical protein
MNSESTIFRRTGKNHPFPESLDDKSGSLLFGDSAFQKFRLTRRGVNKSASPGLQDKP